MNAITPIAAADLPDSIRVGATLDDIAMIQNDGCAAAVFHRAPDTGLIDWLATLAPDQLPSAREIVAPAQVPAMLTDIANAAQTPDTPERARLIADITAMADQFAGLMNVDMLRVRLDVVTTNACRKFHIDAVTARLICTYRGQTTQVGEADTGQDPTQIWSVPQAAPLVLRGTRWPNGAPTRLRHRSPPIEGTGETRLLLVLDPIYDHVEHI